MTHIGKKCTFGLIGNSAAVLALISVVSLFSRFFEFGHDLESGQVVFDGSSNALPLSEEIFSDDVESSDTGYFILIVDDNAVNRDISARGLCKLGYSVSAAQNGREGLDLLVSDKFDFVLLDIVMPVMDGHEV